MNSLPMEDSFTMEVLHASGDVQCEPLSGQVRELFSLVLDQLLQASSIYVLQIHQPILRQRITTYTKYRSSNGDLNKLNKKVRYVYTSKHTNICFKMSLKPVKTNNDFFLSSISE